MSDTILELRKDTVALKQLADLEELVDDFGDLVRALRDSADRAQVDYLNACIRCEHQRIVLPWIVIAHVVVLTLILWVYT